MTSDRILSTDDWDGVAQVTPEELNKHLGKVMIVDVRTPEEFRGEYGHIPGAQLVTLGPELEKFLRDHPHKDREVVFVCRSGGRSFQATLLAIQLGWKKATNLIGGMIGWTARGLPVER